MTHKIKRCFWLVVAVTLLILALTGCSWTAYNSTTYGYDQPTDELYVVKEIRAGRLALASDLDLDGLWFKSADKELGVGGLNEEQDSIEGSAVIGGVPVKIKTGE